MFVFFCDLRRESKSFGVRFFGRFAMRVDRQPHCNDIHFPNA